MEDIKIVKLREEHVEDLRDLFSHCQDYFDLIDGMPACGRKADNELKLVVEGREQICHGVYQGSEIIACVFHIEEYIESDEVTISLMLIKPEDRSSGLGTKLAQNLISDMEAKGYKRVLVGVDEINERALDFWRDLGFTLTGKRQKLMRKNRASDVVYLEKNL